MEDVAPAAAAAGIIAPVAPSDPVFLALDEKVSGGSCWQRKRCRKYALGGPAPPLVERLVPGVKQAQGAAAAGVISGCCCLAGELVRPGRAAGWGLVLGLPRGPALGGQWCWPLLAGWVAW